MHDLLLSPGTISAFLWQPVERWNIFRSKFKAVFFNQKPGFINAACSLVNIKKTTGDGCRMNAAWSIDLFFKTTFTALVTKLLPLLVRAFLAVEIHYLYQSPELVKCSEKRDQQPAHLLWFRWERVVLSRWPIDNSDLHHRFYRWFTCAVMLGTGGAATASAQAFTPEQETGCQTGKAEQEEDKGNGK